MLDWISLNETAFCTIWHKAIKQCASHAGQLVLDIGANQGLYGIWAASHGCEVLMFEPQPTCHAYVKKSMCFNKYSGKTPRLIEQPVLPSHSDSMFVHSQSKCSGVFGAYTSLEKAERDGHAINGADVFSIIGSRHIHILKIDTEGGELGALTHLMPLFTNHQVNIAVIEFTTLFWKQRQVSRRAAWNIIRSLFTSGYKVWIVECIFPHQDFGGKAFATEEELESMILSKSWLQCDFGFKLVV